ncbi:MAG: hypothetical protein A3B68_08800 [Candidatus Melainabacteria bacterium RIFCSPHIGHO2_02_FULL_34_12]|nr:MAG: hypothetical protein A3B68_08800 [Candidatus Melainabacteria bacterium RIFCSPHIGHO2_02_FULL_34_12]
MVFRLFNVLLVGLLLSGIYIQAFAKSVQEECEEVKAAISDVSCKTCGDCAVVTLRTGEKICKQCNEFQCDKIECAECSDSACATQ